MSAYALNNDLSGTLAGAYGAENGLTTKDKLSDTIAKLELARDRAKSSKQTANDAAANKKASDLENRISNLKRRLDRLKAREESEGCQTCKNRKYQDESDDPGVSFKSAAKAQGDASAAVRGHEQEHVMRDRDKAEREGREVVSQSVRIKTAVCPECGKNYVAGGETTTVTRIDPDSKQYALAKKFEVGSDRKTEKGQFLDVVA